MNMKKENKIPVVMIVGDGHSGSTLLDLIMDSHSKIVGVGELSHYCKYINTEKGICSCGVMIADCTFWKNVFSSTDCSNCKISYRGGLDFLLNNKKYIDAGGSRVDIEKYVNSTEKIYKNILKFSGKKVVVDSSKSPDRAESIIRHNKTLDIVLIHLVRDGRGVVYSNIKLGRPSLFFIKKWGIINFKIEIIKKRNKNKKNIFISYEDFVKNPERVLKYILNQVDLSFEDKMLNFRDNIHHQSSGNFNLRITTKNKNSEIKLDKKWKRKMPLKDKIVFNSLFGWLNLFYKLKLKKY